MANTKSINNFLFTLFGFQKTRNWTHLFFIIFIHVAAWCLFLLLPLIFYPIRFSHNRLFHFELLSKLLPIGFFYLNYYYLLPRFFEKRKLLIYFGIVVLSIGIIVLQDVALHTITGRSLRVLEFPLEGVTTARAPEFRENILYLRSGEPTNIPFPPPEPFREKEILGVPRGIVLMAINRGVSLSVVLLLIGGLIRLAYSFLKNQNERKALENAHLNAEVNFLKSQINPHFLFNTLNGIYAQANSKSEYTAYSILKLSNLLRYVLYETGEEKVPLEKDILYINNYIDLQRMRISNKVTINYSIAGSAKGILIAPLVLIPFIENAFKHGVSYSQSSVINIEIRVFEKTLTLLVSNPVIKTDTFATGGLGLKNVTRRLELIYPNKHLLETYQNDYLYIVNLKIELESD